MSKVATSMATGKILLAKTIKFFHAKSSLVVPTNILATRGKPSTWFPPEGLVETAVAKSNMNETQKYKHDHAT